MRKERFAAIAGIVGLALAMLFGGLDATHGHAAPPFTAKQPFGAIFRCDLDSQRTGTCDFTSPTGKILVVETLSVFANPPAGQNAGLQFLYTSDNVNQAAVNLALTDTGFSYDDVHAALHATEAVRLYIYPGTTMTMAVAQDTIATTPIGLTLSGYTVDCGPGPGCSLP
jgi:hypothetical protein